MFERILIATDGSSTAMRAEERAGLVARSHGSSLHAVYAYEPVKSASGPFGAGGPNPAEVGRGALQGFARRFEALAPETHLMEGKALDAISDVARAHTIDLVVVGNVGLGSRVQRAKGSVPHQLAHHAPTDLLIVHTSDAKTHERADRGEALAPYARVVIGVDGSPTSMEALRHAVGIAAPDGAELVVVNAGGDQAVLARAAELVTESGVAVRTRGDDGNPADVLIRVANDEGADLLVVGNVGMKERSAFDRSIPNRVTLETPCDLLLVKTA